MVKIEVTVSGKGVDGSDMWSVLWEAPVEAAKACKRAGVSAKEGLGKVFEIVGGTKKIVNQVVRQVQNKIAVV